MYKIVVLLISVLIFWECKSPVEEEDVADLSSSVIESSSSEEESSSSGLSSSEEESSSSEEESSSSELSSSEEESSSSEEESSSSELSSSEGESSSSEEESSSSELSSSEGESSSSELSSSEEESSSSESSSSSYANTDCEHETNPADKGWLDNILCLEDYHELAGETFDDPDYDNPDRKIIPTVRFVYDLTDSSLYFIDTKRFDYHFEFCEEMLGWVGSPSEYYNQNYDNSPDRRFYQGEINEFPDPEPDVYVLELGYGGNIMTPEQMFEFYRVTQEHFKLAKLYFIPTDDNHKELAEQIRDSIPVIDRASVIGF